MDAKYELQPDESELYTTHKAMKKSFYVLAFFLTFIPPFLWGALALLIAWWVNKKRVFKIILTNHRVVLTVGSGINNSFMLGDIKRIGVKGFGIFGAQDVVVILKGKMLPRTIHDVKESRVLVKKVNEIIKDSET
jgi:hypothetical protein